MEGTNKSAVKSNLKFQKSLDEGSATLNTDGLMLRLVPYSTRTSHCGGTQVPSGGVLPATGSQQRNGA